MYVVMRPPDQCMHTLSLSLLLSLADAAGMLDDRCSGVIKSSSDDMVYVDREKGHVVFVIF